MIVIKGEATKIPKGNYKCPKDGIHRRKKSGRIRGFWGLKLANTHIFYGNWAYYVAGYKVFYSFKFGKTSKTVEEVKKTISMMDLLKEFCPQISMVDEVTTDLIVDRRRFKAVSPAICMQHVNYPEKAWVAFAKGKPYDWKADSHVDHSKEGFLRFRRQLESITKNFEYDFDSFSIGNIVWCIDKKRWYLVDVR